MKTNQHRLAWYLHTKEGKTWAEVAQELGVTRLQAMRWGSKYAGTWRQGRVFVGNCNRHGPWRFWRDHCPKGCGYNFWIKK